MVTHRPITVPSSTYKLFVRAMAERKQIICSYGGYRRELCPIVLGHSKGREVALTYQFAGESKSGLPAGGDWKCLELAKAAGVTLREGPWHAGSKHQQRQSCVEIVDLDVNPDSPYDPKRRVEDLRHDIVDVEVQFDDEYKTGPAHPMPSWFGEALAGCRIHSVV